MVCVKISMGINASKWYKPPPLSIDIFVKKSRTLFDIVLIEMYWTKHGKGKSSLI